MKSGKSESISKTISGQGGFIRSAVEDEECPSNDFDIGEPHGKCWGDGHYECKNCINYREDFKRLGQDFIDFAHQQQGAIQFVSIA